MKRTLHIYTHILNQLRSLRTLSLRLWPAAKSTAVPVWLLAIFIVVSVVFLHTRRITADTGTGSISLTTLGSAAAENFVTLSNTAGSTTNTTLPTGWYITEQGGGARDNEQYAVDTGGSTTGDIYSYGAAASTERALGELRSGTLIPLFGAKFTNNTGATITALDIAYTGEQWRFGGVHSTVADRMDFQYSLDATDLSTGTWIDANALDFNPPITTGTAGALDGNAAANRTALSSTISSLNIPNGATFFIRWNDVDATGADDGLAVDDFSITPQAVVANAPVVPTCPASLTTTFGTATSSGVSATDADGTVTSATITGITPSNPGTITLTGFTPAGGVGGTANATLDVSNTTPVGSYSVTIQWANNDGAPQTANCVVAVNVTAPVIITPIYTIQGSGTSSPLVGQSVTTTGIVTGRKTNGFFIQDPTGDANTNTSDAIFVFTSSAPSSGIAVGDSVSVTGTVAEFESSTTDEPDGVSPVPDPKTATELTSPTTIVLSSGNPLPAALDAASLNIFDPAAGSRGAELEKYEYMRVSVGSITVSEPTNNFGEFWGVRTSVPRPFREPGIELGDPVPIADQGPFAGNPPPNPPIWDGNFERVQVDSDDATSTANVRRTAVTVTTGAVVTGIVGPLDYAFDSYRIVLDFPAVPGVTPGIAAAVPVRARTAQEFTIGHTNLENFSSSNATKLNKASLAIRNVLRTPDILGLIEVDTAASATALANKVNADAANPNINYVAYFGETAGTQDIGFLVNAARVTVVGMPTQYHASTTFTYCGVTDTLHDRPSFVLLATVPQTGGGMLPVTVILNHTKSLIAVDSPRSFGSCGTGTEGARNREKRRLQAEDIADLIQSHISENLVVLGDFNAFDFNDGLTDVVGTIKGTPAPPDQVVEPSTPDNWTYQLTNLLTKLSAAEQYSLLFEGNAQALDHVLVNNLMLPLNNSFAYARLNSDFSDSFAADSMRPERVSDHDAPVAYFTLPPTATVSGDATICAGSSTNVTVTVSDGTAPYTVKLSNGDTQGPSAGPVFTFPVSPSMTTVYTLASGSVDANGLAITGSGSATVNVTPQPTTAMGGNNQTICALGTTAGLGGNMPTSGTGMWSVVSGGTGTFSNATTPNATFTHTGGTGPVVLRWTISNPPCAASIADVTITINQLPTTATVGANQTICALGTTAGLGGNTPISGMGQWSVVSGGDWYFQ
jgi:predicted extracellular nuclease